MSPQARDDSNLAYSADLRARRLRWLALVLVLLALGGGAALLWVGTLQPKIDKVILISIDTLRADHLGYAGHTKPTSPNIDRLAVQSIDFRNAFSQTNTTLPSHATLFTSLYPSVHQANTVRRIPLAEGFTTLAETLGDHGFRTGAFVEGGQLNPCWKLDQGFETYEVFYDETGADMLAEILAAATEWIEAHQEEPFFCFIHSYVVHAPYGPRSPYDRMFDEGYAGDLPNDINTEMLREMNTIQHRPDEPDVRHVVSLYDGEIRYMDEQIGLFLGRLEQNGVDERAIVVFTSDHGEEFAEHGMVGWHGHNLYEEQLHVPLLFRVPGMSPRRIARPARLLDVAPTLMGLLALDTADLPYQGVNLFARDDSVLGDLPLLSEALYPADVWVSFRIGNYKIHYGGGNRGLAFDLKADPGEKFNFFGTDPARDEAWVRRIEDFTAEVRSIAIDVADPIRFDSETEKQLRALGYFE